MVSIRSNYSLIEFYLELKDKILCSLFGLVFYLHVRYSNYFNFMLNTDDFIINELKCFMISIILNSV